MSSTTVLWQRIALLTFAHRRATRRNITSARKTGWSSRRTRRPLIPCKGSKGWMRLVPSWLEKDLLVDVIFQRGAEAFQVL